MQGDGAGAASPAAGQPPAASLVPAEGVEALSDEALAAQARALHAGRTVYFAQERKERGSGDKCVLCRIDADFFVTNASIFIIV